MVELFTLNFKKCSCNEIWKLASLATMASTGMPVLPSTATSVTHMSTPLGSTTTTSMTLQPLAGHFTDTNPVASLKRIYVEYYKADMGIHQFMNKTRCRWCSYF